MVKSHGFRELQVFPKLSSSAGATARSIVRPTPWGRGSRGNGKARRGWIFSWENVRIYGDLWPDSWSMHNTYYIYIYIYAYIYIYIYIYIFCILIHFGFWIYSQLSVAAGLSYSMDFSKLQLKNRGSIFQQHSTTTHRMSDLVRYPAGGNGKTPKEPLIFPLNWEVSGSNLAKKWRFQWENLSLHVFSSFSRRFSSQVWWHRHGRRSWSTKPGCGGQCKVNRIRKAMVTSEDTGHDGISGISVTSWPSTTEINKTMS